MFLDDIVSPLTVKEAATDYQKRRQRERDFDAGKPVSRQAKNPQTDYAKKRARDKKELELGEEQVNELSKGTLANYVKANANDQVQHASSQSYVSGKNGDKYNTSDAWDQRTTKREKGMDRALNKLSQVEEDSWHAGDNAWSSDKNQWSESMDASEPSPVASAITRRILSQRLDLLKQYGPELVGAAVDNVADWVGDVEEIGSSDVSAWVAQVERMLKENPPEAFAEGSENNNTTAQKIFFARSNKAPKEWSYDHVGFITQDGKQIQMSGHKGNDVYVTNDVTDDPEFPKQNIKIVSLSKPVSVPTTNSVGAENCGTFVANVLQANGIKGIDTQKIYSVFKKPQEQGVAEGVEQNPDQVRQTLNAWMNQDQQFKDPTQRAGFQAKVWPYIEQNINAILSDKGADGKGSYPAAPYAAWLLVQHMDAYPQNQDKFASQLEQAGLNPTDGKDRVGKLQFLKDRYEVNKWIAANANNEEYFINNKPLPNPTVNVRNPAIFKDAGQVATSRKDALDNAIAAGNKLLVAAVQATDAKTQPSYKSGVAEGLPGEFVGGTAGGTAGQIAGRELTDEQKLNEIAPLLALGARLFMAAAPKIAQVVGKVGQAGARGVGQAAKAGAGIAAKNAGQIGVGAGAYEIGSSVADIVKDITAKVGVAVDEKTIFELATLAFKYAIPAGIVLAILYGGKKAIDSLFADPKTPQGVAETVDIGQEWMSDTELDQYVPERLQQQWRELLGYDRDGNPSALWANLTGGYEPDVNDPQHRALMVKVANKWFAAKKIPNVKFFDVKDADDDLEWLVQIGQQGMAEGNLNELDIFAPVTTYVRLANGEYVAASWRRNQNLSGGNNASFVNIKPLAPNVAKQLGLDQRLNDPERKYTGTASISSGGPIQGSGPLSDTTIDVVDIMDKKFAKDLGIPDAVFGKVAQWTQQQGQTQPGVAEGDMYGDDEVSWEKGGRRAPTGAFRNPANNYNDNRTGFGRRGREDDEYHVPDPVEPQYNIKVNGQVINQQPFANRAEALTWAKQAVAAGKLDPKNAKLSPINQVNELSNNKLASYKKAAGADASAADKAGNYERGNKRFRGIVKATIKQGDNDAKKHVKESYWTKLENERNTKIAKLVNELKESVK